MAIGREIHVATGQEAHTGWIDEAGKQWDMPARISRVLEALSGTPLRLHPVSGKTEDHHRIHTVHEPEMVTAMQEASRLADDVRGRRTSFDKSEGDTSLIYAGTYGLAMRTVQATVNAARQVAAGTQLSTVLSRPPGHHAGAAYYHGFCYMNNAAFAAKELRRTYDTVAIIDIDVHHGDGTQDIFYESPDVPYVSLHADPRVIMPKSGFADEKGEGLGYGTTANYPFPIGVPGRQYVSLFETAVEKTITYRPDALVVSAGFDGHRGEFTDLPPITGLEDEHYHAVGKIIGALQLPTCVVLEGGYNLSTLPGAAQAFLGGIEVGHAQQH